MGVREGWNFHNDIALNLEMIAKSYLNPSGVYGAEETIYSADEIEDGTFAEVMILLLRRKTNYKVDAKLEEFSRELKDIWNVSGNDIEPETAQELFEKFEQLI